MAGQAFIHLLEMSLDGSCSEGGGHAISQEALCSEDIPETSLKGLVTKGCLPPALR